MPKELTELAFVLDDVVAGRSLTPETIDLPTLRGFLADVETLIKGDVPEASLTDSRVRIEAGSLKVVALVAPLLALDLNKDLAKLDETGDFDAIQLRRAEILELWQLRARKSPSRVYSIASTSLGHPIRITNSSQFQHRGENAWVGVEQYLAGKVVDLGGKQNPNVHLVLADSGKSVKIDATEEQLAGERENQLYKHRIIRAQGEQHLRTKELRKLRLIEFLPYGAEIDEEVLASLWKKGREAWKDVESASEWVDELRGSQ